MKQNELRLTIQLKEKEVAISEQKIKKVFSERGTHKGRKSVRYIH